MYDSIVIGAGIGGLAMADALRRRGDRVLVLERSRRAVQASLRNFGFVTVTGQSRGAGSRVAMRSRDLWLDAAQAAQIQVHQSGLIVAAHREEAERVLVDFTRQAEGEGCEMLTALQAIQALPCLREDPLRAALWSPYERRVEPREALPRLAAWLDAQPGVEVRFDTQVLGVETGCVQTSDGLERAENIFICTGLALPELARTEAEAIALKPTQLQMLRVRLNGAAPSHAVMGDFSLIRYAGYDGLDGQDALRRRLETEAGPLVEAGVHLIAVAGGDGTLVVGDSHHDCLSDEPDPFNSAEVEAMMLDLFDQTLAYPRRSVVERWNGAYAKAEGRDWHVASVMDGVTACVVTTGAGMSMAFGLAEAVLNNETWIEGE